MVISAHIIFSILETDFSIAKRDFDYDVRTYSTLKSVINLLYVHFIINFQDTIFTLM